MTHLVKKKFLYIDTLKRYETFAVDCIRQRINYLLPADINSEGSSAAFNETPYRQKIVHDGKLKFRLDKCCGGRRSVSWLVGSMCNQSQSYLVVGLSLAYIISGFDVPSVLHINLALQNNTCTLLNYRFERS